MRNIFLCMLVMGSLTTYAQKSTHSDVMATTTNGIGISFQEFDGLNSRVANLPQYKTLRDHMGTLQMGMTKQYHGFISAITLSAASGLSGDRDERSSVLRSLGAAIDFGYDVIPSEKIMLYPMIGVGAEKYNARFYTDNRAVAFDDVLEDPDVQNSIRPVNFNNTFITYRAGLGVGVKCGKEMKSSIGLRAGYTGSFKDKAWKSSENQSLAGAPEDGLSRFYVTLVFGHSMHMMK